MKEFIRKREEDEKDLLKPKKVCEFIETIFEISYV
jgi:hypothetical protein